LVPNLATHIAANQETPASFVKEISLRGELKNYKEMKKLETFAFNFMQAVRETSKTAIGITRWFNRGITRLG
jgi:hypothetical protein